MGNFGRDNRGGGHSRSGFNGGNNRGGFNRGGGRSSFGDPRPREMFKTTCSNCGKECEVPFRPTNGKPVYCSDCFEKTGGGSRNDERRPERNSFRAQPQAQASVPNNAQIEALNAKLEAINLSVEKIISLLEPRKIEEADKPKVIKTDKKALAKK